MVLVGKGYTGAEAEATIATIKAGGEIESKNIYLMSSSIDAISSNVRKIKRVVLEYVAAFNDEKYKKYKKHVTKSTDSSLTMTEKNISLHFKMAVIDELSYVFIPYSLSLKHTRLLT